MSVVHLSTTDIVGGATRAAYLLHRGLIGSGFASAMLVEKRRSQDELIVQFQPSMSVLARALRRWRDFVLQRRLAPYSGELAGRFSDWHERTAAEPAGSVRQFSVVNLHWMTGFISPPHFITALDPRTPLVWTLHDMNPFTGGCHYDSGCGKFVADCGACPALGSTQDDDLSRIIHREKARLFSKVASRMTFVAPSRWMKREAGRSSLFRGARIEHIPYGIDTDTFSPQPIDEARDELGVPRKAKVILFVATNTAEKRKGYSYLAQALEDFPRQDLCLLTVGRKSPPAPGGVQMIQLQNVDSTASADRLLALAYSAADCTVVPSQEDNLPLVVLESLACGTPVVAFDTGGIGDAVRCGQTGYLIEKNNVRELRASLETHLRDDTKRRAMSEECRKIAEAEYALPVQAGRYMDLYRGLLSQKPVR